MTANDEVYTTDQAAVHAVEWCATHPGWQRICDIEDVGVFYKTYAELSPSVRRSWDARGGEYAWKEFGHQPCKVPCGFISGKGEFYRNVLSVPRFHNLMTVYKTH